MQRSIFLAKLIGPLLAAIGVALIFNADIFRAMAQEFLKSYALIYLAGLLALAAGLAIVNTHNEWTADWRVVITLIGWLAVIGGIIRIVLPRAVELVGSSMVTAVSNSWIVGEGVVLLALGAWLSYAGYAPGKTKANRNR
jgi:hypothetical protein